MRRTPAMTPEEKNAAYQKWWDSRERCPNCGGLLYHYYRTDNQSITGGVAKPPEGARYLADRCMGKGGWDREAYAATESRTEADKPTTEPCGWVRLHDTTDLWVQSYLENPSHLLEVVPVATQLATQALKPGPYAGRYDEF